MTQVRALAEPPESGCFKSSDRFCDGKVSLQALDNERPRLRRFYAHCGGLFHIVRVGFCFLYAIESNDGNGLRCSSIESDYIFSAGEITTICGFNFHNTGWTHFNESLEAIRIGYLVNINHNVNGPLVLSG